MRDVDVDRVQLLDHRHGVGLAIADQCAFGDRRTANTPGDRRVHLGVAHVDLGGLNVCLGSHAVGNGGVVFLTADGLLLDQLLVAIGDGFGLGQARLCAFERGFIHRRVDLVELLPFLHVGAFLEQALENDAVDLRPNFRNAEGRGAAWQLGGQGIGLRLNGDHADLRGLSGRCRFFLFTSAEQRCQGDGSDQSGNSWLKLHEDPRVRRAECAQEVWKGKKQAMSG